MLEVSCWSFSIYLGESVFPPLASQANFLGTGQGRVPSKQQNNCQKINSLLSRFTHTFSTPCEPSMQQRTRSIFVGFWMTCGPHAERISDQASLLKRTERRSSTSFSARMKRQNRRFSSFNRSKRGEQRLSKVILKCRCPS